MLGSGIFQTMLHQGGRLTNQGMYPTFRPEDNFVVKTVISLFFYLIKIFTFPIKFFYRKDYGARYFSFLDSIIYGFVMIWVSSWFLLYLVIAPYYLFQDYMGREFSFKMLVEPEFLLNLPLISFAFAIIVINLMYKSFKKDRNATITGEQTHSYYYGSTRFFQFLLGQSFNGVTIGEEQVRTEIEPFLCSIAALILIPLDPILGLYLLIASGFLKLEIWYEDYQRKEIIHDMLDSVYDAQYMDYMFKKFQEHQSPEFDFESFYQALTTHRNTMMKDKIKLSHKRRLFSKI